jgi:HK97 family phage prohead protease
MTATLELPAGQTVVLQRDGQSTELIGVSFPQRTIELVVIPYDVEADVPHPTNPTGPRVTEVISRGAFDGVERRPNRIKANREHDEKLTFGRALALYPSRENGLVARISVAKTPLGDETLELADHGDLEASAQFRASTSDFSWETRRRYRVLKAWLRHIGLVADGAYGENASVLAVRATPAGPPPPVAPAPARPRLQALALQEALAREAEMNARWGLR